MLNKGESLLFITCWWVMLLGWICEVCCCHKLPLHVVLWSSEIVSTRINLVAFTYFLCRPYLETLLLLLLVQRVHGPSLPWRSLHCGVCAVCHGLNLSQVRLWSISLITGEMGSRRRIMGSACRTRTMSGARQGTCGWRVLVHRHAGMFD